jgi:hypothetical protein
MTAVAAARLVFSASMERMARQVVNAMAAAAGGPGFNGMHLRLEQDMGLQEEVRARGAVMVRGRVAAGRVRATGAAASPNRVRTPPPQVYFPIYLQTMQRLRTRFSAQRPLFVASGLLTYNDTAGE